MEFCVMRFIAQVFDRIALQIAAMVSFWQPLVASYASSIGQRLHSSGPETPTSAEIY